MKYRLLLALGLVLAACGSDDAAVEDADTVSTPTPTVAGVGELPDTVPTLPASTSSTTSSEPLVVETRPIETDDGELAQPIGERVDGNRVLVIGDSIMASTATRFGREMCDSLTQNGWSVEVDAEPGRFVGFGLRVVDRRLPDGPDPDPEEDWDAAVVHLGSNYALNKDDYREAMTQILFQLAPRPTLVFTVTEYRSSWSQVNEVLREMDELFENVTLIDWEFAARSPGVLSSDGLHPTGAGEDVLVGLTSLGLGEFDGPEGDCLRSSFTDDSAISSGGGSPNGSSSSSSSSSSTSSSSSSSTSGTGGSSSTGSGGTTTLPGGTDTGGDTGGTTTIPGGGTDTGGSTEGSDTGGGADTGGTDTGGTDTDGTDTGGADTGGTDTDGTDTGGADTGGADTGGTDSGGADTGGADTGGTDTGGTDSGGADTGGADTGGADTGGADTGGADTGGADTGGADTGGADTGGADTGGADTGGADTGGADTGGASTGTTGTATSGTTGADTTGADAGGGADATDTTG